MRPRPAAPALAALLLAAALAGCAGGPRDSPGYDPAQHGTALEGTIEAEAAVVAGLAVERSASAVTVRLGPAQAPARWSALVVADVRTAGSNGTVFLFGPEVRLAGDLTWTLNSLALSADNLTGFVRSDAGGLKEPLGAAPPRAIPAQWQDASDARFFSDRLALAAGGPVTVNAERVLLAATDGLRELGTGAVLEGGTWRASTRVATIEAPATVVVDKAPGPRVQLSLAGPRGSLAAAGRPALELSSATVIDGRAPDLRLELGPGGVRAKVQMTAFQVYHGGRPMLPARVVLEPASADVALRDGQGAVGARVREASGDADAVFKAVRISGDGNVTMPGFLSVWESWPPELRLLMLSGPWALNFLIADVFLEGLRLLTGQYLPQPLQAGQEKDVTVAIEGAKPGGQVSVVLEGQNFPDARMDLRLR